MKISRHLLTLLLSLSPQIVFSADAKKAEGSKRSSCTAQVEVTGKLLAGEDYRISVVRDLTVKDLITDFLVTSKRDWLPEEVLVLYSGEALSPKATLKSYGLEQQTVVHIVRRKPVETFKVLVQKYEENSSQRRSLLDIPENEITKAQRSMLEDLSSRLETDMVILSDFLGNLNPEGFLNPKEFLKSEEFERRLKKLLSPSGLGYSYYGKTLSEYEKKKLYMNQRGLASQLHLLVEDFHLSRSDFNSARFAIDSLFLKTDEVENATQTIQNNYRVYLSKVQAAKLKEEKFKDYEVERELNSLRKIREDNYLQDESFKKSFSALIRLFNEAKDEVNVTYRKLREVSADLFFKKGNFPFYDMHSDVRTKSQNRKRHEYVVNVINPLEEVIKTLTNKLEKDLENHKSLKETLTEKMKEAAQKNLKRRELTQQWDEVLSKRGKRVALRRYPHFGDRYFRKINKDDSIGAPSLETYLKNLVMSEERLNQNLYSLQAELRSKQDNLIQLTKENKGFWNQKKIEDLSEEINTLKNEIDKHKTKQKDSRIKRMVLEKDYEGYYVTSK